MKVYVNEMPKDCIDCPCESEYYCNLLNEDVGCCKWGEIHKNCPLQTLADHDKKVCAKVVEENQALKERWEKLKEYLTQKTEADYVGCYIYPDNLKAMEDILEKMQELEE